MHFCYIELGIIVRFPSERIYEAVKNLTLDFRKKFEWETRFRTVPRELISKAVRTDKLSRMVENERTDGQVPSVETPHFQRYVDNNPLKRNRRGEIEAGEG